MRTEGPEMHKKMNVELYPVRFLWPSSRLSTISPWRAHKLSIALSLQDTHIGEVQPLLFTFYLFPLPCARLSVLPPSSFMYSSPPLPLSSPSDFNSESSLFFLLIIVLLQDPQRTYFSSVCISLSVSMLLSFCLSSERQSMNRLVSLKRKINQSLSLPLDSLSWFLSSTRKNTFFKTF